MIEPTTMLDHYLPLLAGVAVIVLAFALVLVCMKAVDIEGRAPQA